MVDFVNLLFPKNAALGLFGARHLQAVDLWLLPRFFGPAFGRFGLVVQGRLRPRQRM